MCTCYIWLQFVKLIKMLVCSFLCAVYGSYIGGERQAVLLKSDCVNVDYLHTGRCAYMMSFCEIKSVLSYCDVFCYTICYFVCVTEHRGQRVAPPHELRMALVHSSRRQLVRTGPPWTMISLTTELV